MEDKEKEIEKLESDVFSLNFIIGHELETIRFLREERNTTSSVSDMFLKELIEKRESANYRIKYLKERV